ncbi:MAG: serine protease [Desulfosoma sp.]
MFSKNRLRWLWFPFVLLVAQKAFGGLPETIELVRRSVVAVGTYEALRRPPSVFLGTGFVVAQGAHILTNAHVLPEKLNKEHREVLAAFLGRGSQVQIRELQEVVRDDEHDVVLLRMKGEPLPALGLDPSPVREGQEIAFTGFPIGMVLGLYPVTHRGIISAVTPMMIPVKSGQTLTPDLVQRLRNAFEVYQLDATAYPGNSGSPLFHPNTGRVLGIVNKVLVTQGKEKVLETPSGITFAVPIIHGLNLMRKVGLSP